MQAYSRGVIFIEFEEVNRYGLWIVVSSFRAFSSTNSSRVGKSKVND